MISSRYLDVLRSTSKFSDRYLASSIYVVRAKGLVYPLDIIFYLWEWAIALHGRVLDPLGADELYIMGSTFALCR